MLRTRELDTTKQRSRNHDSSGSTVMTRSLSHLMFTAVAVTAIALPSIAFADEPVDAGPLPEATAVRYPRAVIARPLTLPSRVAVLGADAIANHDFGAMWGAPILGTGITDELEVLVPYTFATRELETKGSLAIDVGYAFVRGALGGKLEVVARARSGYDFLTEDRTAISFGVHAQYNLTDYLCIVSGVPGTQQLRIAPEDQMGRTPIDVSVPVGIGFQAMPTLYLQLDTKLAQLSISDSENLLFGRDTTPASLTVVWNAVHALDLQAAIGTDLSNDPGDAMTFLVGARYYAGRL